MKAHKFGMQKKNRTWLIFTLVGVVCWVISMRFASSFVGIPLVDGEFRGGWNRFLIAIADMRARPFAFVWSFAVLWRSLIIAAVLFLTFTFFYSGNLFTKWKWDDFYEVKRQMSKVRPQGMKVSVDKKAAISIKEMVGLKEVKEEIDQIINYNKVQKVRKRRGMQANDLNLNFVFYGNPGTGKTVVARYLAAELKKHKILKMGQLVEVDRSIMVACGQGQTAPLVHEVVESALGGVLFIDEAYTLTSTRDEFGIEAVNTLLKLMEDYKEQLVVIVAGYNDLMQDFMDSNPGLESRFTKHIKFPDYDADELVKIFKLMCKKRGYICGAGTADKLHGIFERVIRGKGDNFANGRYVRNLFEEAIEKQAMRVAKKRGDAFITLLPEDICVREFEAPECSAVDEINEMVGLDQVKREIDEIIDFTRVQQMRKAQGLDYSDITNHMVFMGNPGTGKTTMARYVAEAFREVGALARGHMVEVDRGMLVAEYQGQTAPRVMEMVKKAKGGVLFIDEAYTLTKSDDSYGQEAVATLLKLMEDHRGEFMVIVAGYPDLMKEFIDSNPGLQSRFRKYIEFPDYNAEELMAVFELICKKRDYTCTEEARAKMLEIFRAFVELKDDNFANGRIARNVFEDTIAHQASRVAKIGWGVDKEMLTTIEAEDCGVLEEE